MNKILIIGQAPPAVKQQVPYDSTLLYDWLGEIGISVEQAQEIFDFDAVYDQFPGYDNSGGHLKPSFQQMEEYYKRSLENKLKNYSKVILLGGVAKSYLNYKKRIRFSHKVLELLHPSQRNISLYLKNKDSILESLKQFINE